MTPRDADDLPFLEFLALLMGIDARHEQRKQWAEKTGKWVP